MSDSTWATPPEDTESKSRTRAAKDRAARLEQISADRIQALALRGAQVDPAGLEFAALVTFLFGDDTEDRWLFQEHLHTMLHAQLDEVEAEVARRAITDGVPQAASRLHLPTNGRIPAPRG